MPAGCMPRQAIKRWESSPASSMAFRMWGWCVWRSCSVLTRQHAEGELRVWESAPPLRLCSISRCDRICTSIQLNSAEGVGGMRPAYAPVKRETGENPVRTRHCQRRVCGKAEHAVTDAPSGRLPHTQNLESGNLPVMVQRRKSCTTRNWLYRRVCLFM